MRWSIERRVTGAVVLALLVLAGIGALYHRSTSALLRDVAQAEHTYKISGLLRAVQADLADAESAQRGYLITAKQDYLEPYFIARTKLEKSLDALDSLTVGNPRLQQRAATLRRTVARRMDVLTEVIEARAKGGYSAALPLVQTGRGKQLMDQIRDQIEQMETQQARRLEEEVARARAGARRTLVLVALGGAVALALLVLAAFIVYRDVRERRRVEAALQEANKKMVSSLRELEVRNREINLLSDLVEMLQACTNPQEAYALIPQITAQLFPGAKGAIATLSASRDQVEIVLSWGHDVQGESVFAPEDCWAVRRGHLHAVSVPSEGQLCPHLGPNVDFGYLCVPMIAQGEAIGILHLQRDAGGAQSSDDALQPRETRRRLAVAVAEHVGLALANLKMRDTLRQQSIRDPLTGLFNRRYLEESLDREVRRAARNQRPLSVVMLDIDHFKRFNDTFGHEAGDSMLRSIANLLAKRVRGGDIPCRYGGEEFTLVLVEAPLEAVLGRTEKLRQEASELDLQFHGQSMGKVTLSMGVGLYPKHGDTPQDLLHAADVALYQAKQAGRNRVIVAQAAG